jgi:pimeloyl-ACP methyl ester carboxylesterase
MTSVSGSIDPRVDVVRRYRPIEELVPRHWQERDVEANGIRQHFLRTGGSGPPLVLLHGFMEGAIAWLPVARALESDYDVVMLDARGHGRSARAGGHFEAEILAKDVATALAALNISGVRLLGFSLGATTGAFLVDRYPDAVSRLILAGLPEGGPGTDMTASPGYQAWLTSYSSWLESLANQNHTERMVESLSQLPPGAPIPPEETYVGWVQNSANLDVELVRMSGGLWGKSAMWADAARDAIARLERPTLVIKSGFTMQSSGPLTIREEPSTNANVTVLRFENTGHLILRDRFDAFVKEVREFLS